MIRHLYTILLAVILLIVPAGLMAETFYVTYDGQPVTDGWPNTTTLESAINQATANDVIWIQGSDDPSKAYTVPTTGYTVKSGVKIYGGFKGTENSVDAREYVDGKQYKLRYRTMLSGDTEDGRDFTTGANFIFPTTDNSNKRNDNATHVLTLAMTPDQASGNNNTYPTIINGLTIARGHSESENGAGIYVMGDNRDNGGRFVIEKCFFLGNYAPKGGAIYVAGTVMHKADGNMISQCGFFNNAAGDRTTLSNSGAAIYLVGEANVVNCVVFNNANGGICGTDVTTDNVRVVNSTIVRNSGSGVDGSNVNVYNSVVWGNTYLYSTDSPNFQYSAYPEASDATGSGNIYLSAKNNDTDGPAFVSPSLKTGYDSDFVAYSSLYPTWDWESQGETALVNKGDNTLYRTDTYGDYDLKGVPRIQNTIDIGAYEYQPASNIRYVTEQGAGTGNGTSWANASSKIQLQAMIDELATKGGGEVWVAAGTYAPQELLDTQKGYTYSFRMRNNVSVYGGFAGTETSKNERQKKADGMPWEFTNETILQGTNYTGSPSWGTNSIGISSDSRHVVWFNGEDFTTMTYLDGVTIQGGNAQGGTGVEDFCTDRGGGIYMKGDYASVTNCIIRYNAASGNGGGVYMDGSAGGGRVRSSLIYNNSSDVDGGAVYTDVSGLIHRSMLTNNSARRGAGAFLNAGTYAADKTTHPEYLIMSTCVVSNNTSTLNGAVYCGKGGVLLHNTIVNNYCPKTTDNSDSEAAQTGGLYIDEYALVINSVLWNNRFGSTDGTNIPMYAKNPSADKVRFMYNAISGTSNAVWNNTLQEETLFLADDNDGTTEMTGPDFSAGFPQTVGVDQTLSSVEYFWKPDKGSGLWSAGLELGQFPDEVLIAPEVDMAGNLFANKPTIGAIHAENQDLVCDDTTDPGKLILYVDAESVDKNDDGSSWDKAYRSLNDAISYMSTLSSSTVSGRTLEIRVQEGDLWPRYSYVNEDPKTATIDLLKMESKATLRIVGGYHRTETGEVERKPLTYRSVLNGNREGEDIKEGNYHVVTVEAGAKVEIDGFHIINGYAAGTASIQHGAGLLAYAGAEVTLLNCIFEDNTAATGAAVYAQGAKVTMRNCVVNNNTNTTESGAIIDCANLTLEHVTIVNNEGAAPSSLGSSSFALNNTSGNSTFNESISTLGAEGAKHFANPANDTGAKLGFDTYLGGYTEYRPLTSSYEAATNIINKVSTGTSSDTYDITTLNERDLGGVPDLGAYEADLPKSGSVIYVKVDGTGDGLSWGNAMGDINAAVQAAVTYNNKLSDEDKKDADKRAQVWVAAGTYENDPGSDDPACFIIEEGVDVFGGFPEKGTPGMTDRRPLVSTSIYSQDENGNKMADSEIALYETIIQPKTKTSDSDYTNVTSTTAGTDIQRRVLSQRDENCPRTFGEAHWSQNSNYETNYYVGDNFEISTKWDGFTIQNGFLNIGDENDDGGAGARIFVNVSLENCIIQNNENYQRYSTRDEAGDSRGGGVYVYGGSLVNCYIQKNKLGRVARDNTTLTQAGVVYGGGVYLNYGTLYNCVIADNQARGSYADGGGIVIECGEFYNNTVINNKADGYNRSSGGLRVWVGSTMKNAGFSGTVKIFNSIIYGNTGFGNVTGNADLSMSNSRVEVQGTLVSHTPSSGTITVAQKDQWGTGEGIYLDASTCPTVTEAEWESLFENTNDKNYRLKADSKGLNFGINELEVVRISPPTANGWMRYNNNSIETRKQEDQPSGTGWRRAVVSLVKGENFTEDNASVSLFDYTDMDYTDRIKDCTVDAGAYERSNEDNVAPDTQTSTGKAIYYVTYNGHGTANADSPENAACAMKLQEVLNAAGTYAKNNQNRDVIVKIAGYEGGAFEYHVNALAEANNPQSYSYVIPYGITVMGGYNEGTYTNGELNKDYNWNDDNRDAAQYMTVFSAIKEGTSTTQEVNGYHTVTFGEKPTDWTGNDKQTIIDGIYLEDGSATSLSGSGSDNTKGGAAIVPAWGHVRNCVVRNNKAVQGGGLYVEPGGMVSGCVIMDNEAEDEGGGVYADNTNASASNRAYLISNTIVQNDASSGGGVYIEDGAAMTVNSVIWGNTASSDKNVSAPTTAKYADELLTDIASNTDNSTDDSGTSTTGEIWYMFNNCYVESIELPGNFSNSQMTSELTTYFTNEYYTLKAYSPLINHGMVAGVQTELERRKNVAAYDMQGTVRIATGETLMDVGALAFIGGQIDQNSLVTRLFVSQNSSHVLAESESGKADTYMGKTFYTPFTWLGDALDYINTVRESESVGADARKATFEIFVANGTYKPRYRREDASSDGMDQRQNSFIIPYNVKIYGGFTGEEAYSSKADGESDITQISFSDSGTKTFTPLDETGVQALLKSRQYTDFNENNIAEAWEMAQQTILSGNINLSATEQKVYHVVYSSKDTGTDVPASQAVVLDGITIQEGLTLENLTDEANRNEVGRGAGVYSNGVDYTIVNCRLLDNKAVRGGGVFVRDANLMIVNSMLAGNSTFDNTSASGGAAFVTSTSSGGASLKAVNTLWANNESAGSGGAIGSDAETSSTGNNTTISLMNNTFVMNKAADDAVLHHTGGTVNDILVNTVMWGNVAEESTGEFVDMTYSASDKDYANNLFGQGNTLHNILLNTENLAVDGPRFQEPTTVVGVAGYDLKSRWNPIAVSPLTDHGNGTMKVNDAGEDTSADTSLEKTYAKWFEDNEASTYADAYMGSETYKRYSGPKDEKGKQLDKVIDIGVYEYQFEIDFSKMDAIYVATVGSGTQDGTNWQNATADLRGALIGAANPTSTNPENQGVRNVYIMNGEYEWPVSYTGTTFPVSTTNTVNWSKLNIVGSCTGTGDSQNFSNPTVIRNHPYVDAVASLMDFSTTDKQINVSGLTFINTTNTTTTTGTGVNVTSIGENASLTMKNVAFRYNAGNGVNIASVSGKALFVNALFADNGTGLSVSSGTDKTTLVNTTFANNTTDMTSGLTNVYNSTAWKNTAQNMPSGDTYNNKVFAANTDNDNIQNGPNFRDPGNTTVEDRDYRIRPSLTLLNKGSNDLYKQHALGNEEIPETETDLYNVSRVIDEIIDIGAYEYEAQLQPIIYVKEGVAGKGDGSSWSDAMDDLQNAANLAGIHANTNNTNAYVFVHNNVNHSQALNVQLPNAKIYGGMQDETTTADDTGDKVNELLNKRAGLLELESPSELSGTLTISANSVVDGFKVTAAPTINNGMLSTSVVTANVSGQAEGLLYNTLVEGSVSDVKTVNVTATGTIATVDGNANNRESVTGDNKYVTDDGWKYQLNENSPDINGGTFTDISTYMKQAGHDRDIAGNKRIRATVDNGCFETWNITADMTSGNVVAEEDYPHGKSVVYVRHDAGTTDNPKNDGAELLITKEYTTGSPFNPGFLLLEHRAGLRANGNAVSLTNFAVERNLYTSGTDVAVMPFAVTKTEGDATLSLYDGAERAAYEYQYNATDGAAWTSTTYGVDRDPITTGWLLTGTDGNKMRFYGESYEENLSETSKDIRLVKNNFLDNWAANKFTHKENMSWNLFGSPYLCAMNYQDMEYGRVLYGYQDGKYVTINAVENNIDGYIPAGDAVFTQTATLKEYETFTVENPTESNTKVGSAYQGGTNLTVAISRAYTATRSGESPADDKLLLKAVPAEASRTDFDINADGVKWMSDSVPQLYAVQGNGRYSLLSAVNIEGEVNVGVTLPETGMYTFFVPEDCDRDAYETVILKDSQTGKTVDLLEGNYDFSTMTAGDIAGRFSVSFNRALDDRQDNDLKVWCPSRGVVQVEGTKSGDAITVYSVAGIAVASRVAVSYSETIPARIDGVIIVEVIRDGKAIVRKLRSRGK